jgi:hypothetical protein
MKKASFHHDHARQPRQTTTPDDHARPRLTTTTPIFWTCWLLHHVANREAFHPFFFPSPLLHLGSMWQRVDIYSMESADSSTNIRVCAIVSTSLKLANWCWPWNTTHYLIYKVACCVRPSVCDRQSVTVSLWEPNIDHDCLWPSVVRAI